MFRCELPSNTRFASRGSVWDVQIFKYRCLFWGLNPPLSLPSVRPCPPPRCTQIKSDPTRRFKNISCNGRIRRPSISYVLFHEKHAITPVSYSYKSVRYYCFGKKWNKYVYIYNRTLNIMCLQKKYSVLGVLILETYTFKFYFILYNLKH